MKFNVTLDRDEDGVWIVECPSIPGCVSQDQTREEALDKYQGRVDAQRLVARHRSLSSSSCRTWFTAHCRDSSSRSYSVIMTNIEMVW